MGVMMAVDVYVMPLWRFKAGDFSTAVERLGGVTLLAPQTGIVPRKRPSLRGWLAQRRAKREVRAICREVETVNQRPVHWNDEGDVVYTSQFHASESIQSFLWWLDRRDVLEFRDQLRNPDDGSYWKIAADRNASYPHLARNGYYNGYFLPVDFERPLNVEPYKIFGQLPAARAVCSTPRALVELERISKEVDLPRNYQFDRQDPFASPREALDQLRMILELSDRHELPVTFYG
jgi:hypothetical protein